MSSVLEKSLAIIELLVDHPAGLSVSAIAQRIDQPASGVHRLLNELVRHGYVRQVQNQGDYALTIRLSSLGLSFLGRAGITDVAQPVLDRLAKETGELIRLSVIDADKLTWVAVAQGSTSGLRYDPGAEQGVVVHLATSSGGMAWLSTLSDEEALARISAQGMTRPERPDLDPPSIPVILQTLAATRARGYAIAVDSYIVGMAAMAIPVRYRTNGPTLGCVSIAGPAVRMTPARMAHLAPLLSQAAIDLGEAAAGSHYFLATMRQMDPVSDAERRSA